MKRWAVILVIIFTILLLIFIGIGILYSTSDKDPSNPLDKKTEPIQDENPEPIQDQNPVCLSRGCEPGMLYIGSKNSDKYYTCECHYADKILEENVICFSSDSDATNKGYTKVEDC